MSGGGGAPGPAGAMWSGRSSFTSLVVGVFVVYVVHTCWVMYGIVYTRPCAADGNCILPYLARRPKLQVSGGGMGAVTCARAGPGRGPFSPGLRVWAGGCWPGAWPEGSQPENPACAVPLTGPSAAPRPARGVQTRRPPRVPPYLYTVALCRCAAVLPQVRVLSLRRK